MPEAPFQTLAAPVAIAGQAPGIGAFSAPPTIVCNPSQANAREVNSYQSLLDACSTLKNVGASPGMAGPRVLALDSANGVIVDVTSNVYDPGPNYELRGILTNTTDGIFNLTLGGPSFAQPPSSLRNIIVSSVDNTTIWTIDLAGKNVTIDLYDSIINGGAPSAATMVFVDSVGGGNAQINLHGNSQLADYAIDWTSAQAAGSELNVLVQDMSSVIGLAIAPILSGLTITACSPGAGVDSSFYTNLEIRSGVGLPIVFQPNGGSYSGTNVAVDETGLQTILAGVSGPSVVWFNFSLGEYGTTGATDFFGDTIRGFINDPGGVEGVVPTIYLSATTPNVWSAPPTEVTDLIISATGGPFWGFSLSLTLRGQTQLTNNDGYPLMNTGGVGRSLLMEMYGTSSLPVVNVITLGFGGGSGDYMTLWLFDAATLAAGAIAVLGVSTLQIYVCSSAVTLDPSYATTPGCTVTYLGAGGGAGGPYASLPASAPAWTEYFVTDGPTSYVYDGTLWRPITGGMLGTSPPTVAAGGWTLYEAGGATTSFTDDHGSLLLSCTNAGSGEDARLATRTIGTPGSAWTWTVNVSALMPFQTGDSHEVGICTRLSSSGSYERFTIRCDTSGNLQYTWYRATANNTGTSPTYTFSAAAPSNGLAVGSQAGITGVWLRLNFDGTNRNLYMSLNGYDWSRLYQFTNTTFFGSNPDQYGIVIGSSSTSTEVLAGRYSSGLFTQP